MSSYSAPTSAHLDPDNFDPVISKDFGQNYWIAGGAYFLGENAMAYLEAKLDTGQDEFGKDRFNVVALGLRFDFSAVHERIVP